MGHVGPPVLVVCGLRAEARIAAGPGVVTVCGGGDAAALEAAIARAIGQGVAGVLSFGIAGGLAPQLAPGAIVLGTSVRCGAESFACDPSWLERLVPRLPAAHCGVVAGVGQPVADVAQKARLALETGALAVDMESHIAASLAHRQGLPFAALRVVSDDARHTLPPAALVGMRPDGRADIAAVLRALWAQPGQLPALVRTARDAGRAFASLQKCRRMLGQDFGAASRAD